MPRPSDPRRVFQGAQLFLQTLLYALNLCERVWTLVKRQVSCARYEETVAQCKAACEKRLPGLAAHAEQERSLLPGNF